MSENQNKTEYEKYYNKEGFFVKIKNHAALAGIKVIYVALSLYFVLIDEQTPLKAKSIIVAALGYFIFPMDIIPDLTPILGFSDDLGALVFAYHQIKAHLNEKHTGQAKQKLLLWFKNANEKDFEI